MTAEVAILNANAIALAADSAVTVRGQKIYNSALKVFALSKVAPVGVMVYGNAALMDVPWETLVKVYRRQLKGRTFPRLEEYTSDFLKFIRRSTTYFPVLQQRQYLRWSLESYLRDILKPKLEAAVKKLGASAGSITPPQVSREFDGIVDNAFERISALSLLPDMTKEFEKSLWTDSKKEFDSAMNEVLENLLISQTARTKLRKIGAMLLCRNIFSGLSSGLVIAGFGEKEIYPGLFTYEIDAVIKKRIKFRKIEDKSHTVGKHSCFIIPFAQDEMVKAFMEGSNPAVVDFIKTCVGGLLNRFPELLQLDKLKGSEKEKKRIKDDFSKATKKIMDEFFGGHFKNYIRRHHIDPIMSMASVLPKDELAAMAEALVNLTAFKRHMSDSAETVGGPIDVAVISKGDGLVWVKRKHYFPPNLNQHFFDNYFREVAK